jgi:hypothetical protein
MPRTLPGNVLTEAIAQVKKRSPPGNLQERLHCRGHSRRRGFCEGQHALLGDGPVASATLLRVLLELNRLWQTSFLRERFHSLKDFVRVSN